MTTSSARPEYLQRYAMLVTDRSNAARLAGARAASTLATYCVSSPDQPVRVDAPTVTDHALGRSDRMLARVRRVATAFTIADRSDQPVVVIDDDQFSRMFLGALTAAGDDDGNPDDRRSEVLYEQGWRQMFEGTHTIGPADLAGSFEVLAGAEVTRTSFFELDKNGLDAAVGMEGFAGVRMEADGSLEAGAVSGQGHAEASVGAEASAGANARLNLDEVHVDASGGAFLGGRAGLDGSLEAIGVEAKAEGEVRAGIGADFSGEGHFGWDRVGFEFGGGLALGLGAGGRGGISVNPRETLNDAVRLGTQVHRDGAKATRVARAKTEELIDDGLDVAGDVYRGGREMVDDGLDFVRNPFGQTGTVSLDIGRLPGR